MCISFNISTSLPPSYLPTCLSYQGTYLITYKDDLVKMSKISYLLSSFFFCLSLYVKLPIYLSFKLSIYPSVYLSLILSISFYLYIYLSIYLPTFHPYLSIFALSTKVTWWRCSTWWATSGRTIRSRSTSSRSLSLEPGGAIDR